MVICSINVRLPKWCSAFACVNKWPSTTETEDWQLTHALAQIIAEDSASLIVGGLITPGYGRQPNC